MNSLYFLSLHICLHKWVYHTLLTAGCLLPPTALVTAVVSERARGPTAGGGGNITVS